MKTVKIKVPDYIKRMTKEHKKLVKKIKALEKALENKEFKLKTSKNQREKLRKQLYYMSRYEDVLADRIGSDMSDEVEDRVATQSKPFSVSNKGEVKIYDDPAEIVIDIIDKIEKKMKEKNEQK